MPKTYSKEIKIMNKFYRKIITKTLEDNKKQIFNNLRKNYLIIFNIFDFKKHTIVLHLRVVKKDIEFFP